MRPQPKINLVDGMNHEDNDIYYHNSYQLEERNLNERNTGCKKQV